MKIDKILKLAENFRTHFHYEDETLMNLNIPKKKKQYKKRETNTRTLTEMKCESKRFQW